MAIVGRRMQAMCFVLIVTGPVAQVAAIARYDGRSAMGLSEAVKAQHRLPFFTNFVHLAARIEDLLGTLEPAPSGAARPVQPHSSALGRPACLQRAWVAPCAALRVCCLCRLSPMPSIPSPAAAAGTC